MRRNDGSTFNENQLRHKGKFIKPLITLTALDRHILAGSGYTSEEMRQAERELNVKLAERVEAGESERELIQAMYAAI